MNDLEQAITTARSSIAEERTRIADIPDPGSTSQNLVLNPDILASLKRRHKFLEEYDDNLFSNYSLETLISLEATSLKLKNLEKAKDCEDKLSNNRDNLESTFSQVPAGTDNRWSTLHEARFLPGAACSAKKLWLRAREVLGDKPHIPVSTYDMHSIGLAGHITSKGWCEIHNPGSSSLQLRQFSINNCGKKVTTKGSIVGDDELQDIGELGELKCALRVLREAMAYVHPWNKSVSALEGFLVQSNYCSQDLEGIEKQAVILVQFIDYVLRENSNRWKGMECFLTAGDLKGAWDSFFGARPQAILVKVKKQFQSNKQAFQFSQFSQNNQPSPNPSTKTPYTVTANMFLEDMCVNYNMGRCMKPPGTCFTKKGRALRHVCNFKPDPNNPTVYCGAPHAACYFH